MLAGLVVTAVASGCVVAGLGVAGATGMGVAAGVGAGIAVTTGFGVAGAAGIGVAADLAMSATASRSFGLATGRALPKAWATARFRAVDGSCLVSALVIEVQQMKEMARIRCIN